MKIKLPADSGNLEDYVLTGRFLGHEPIRGKSSRVLFSAAHVVADPKSAREPSLQAPIDWESTLAYRRHLAGLGLGIAEAMDTAQRGAGLNWETALELIRQTKIDLPNALVFNGAGTDHLIPSESCALDDVIDAYRQQIEAIQQIDGRIIVMASRALVQAAKSDQHYKQAYKRVLEDCDQPVIIHWLGDMFDPQLQGYWGAEDFQSSSATVIEIINENEQKIDGIKLSLLDKHKEIELRRALPKSVKMYTGDDFNYPELIAGDEFGYSDALLGIFDPIAPAATKAINCLSSGAVEEFHRVLESTVPLARRIFAHPTQYYKTGVVFLAWLNGHQDHFVMVGGAQSMRPLPYFVDCFRLADEAGLLKDPECAVGRMKQLLAVYGADN